MTVVGKRVYEPSATDDGYRVLVDRLWPRGLAKATAEFDEWAKAVSPSTPLRQWYGHDPAKYGEFRRRYLAELAEQDDEVQRLRGIAGRGRLTLLTATSELALSHLTVLAELLANG